METIVSSRQIFDVPVQTTSSHIKVNTYMERVNVAKFCLCQTLLESQS